jgi:hypothetical protein
MSTHLIHRQEGYNLLTGSGLKIGAFHQRPPFQPIAPSNIATLILKKTLSNIFQSWISTRLSM